MTWLQSNLNGKSTMAFLKTTSSFGTTRPFPITNVKLRPTLEKDGKQMESGPGDGR